jgi:DNA-binding transcriptional LysR family regulator
MRIPDIDLDLMRCFVTVVESDGFTQASKRLHLTQSAITLKIKRLEDLLQLRLFQRTTKPLRLTQEGEVVLGYAYRLLDLNREMIQRVVRSAEPKTLRLGVVAHFGQQFLPTWLSEFRKAWPDARLVTDMHMTPELLKGLEEDRFDLVIAAAGYAAMSDYKMGSMIQEQPLQKETLIWVQAENSKIDPRKDPLPLVMFGPLCRFRRVCLETLRDAGRTWEIIHDGGSLTSVQTGVGADLGLSILPPHSLVPGIEIAGKKARLPALPTSKLSVYTLKSPSEPLVPRLASFLVEAVARWENEVRLAAAPPLQKKSKAPALTASS